RVCVGGLSARARRQTQAEDGGRHGNPRGVRAWQHSRPRRRAASRSESPNHSAVRKTTDDKASAGQAIVTPTRGGFHRVLGVGGVPVREGEAPAEPLAGGTP